eukprot:TRINITY_DN111838_c0_g1_i1.p1 TRINITY_DN111838_c0_g1~~TRINITY_DN111838_c0_g1_i1.p1  ORF type:complete len:137 (+),score=23.60 TRINITY_DN111838_c0_g1_i1:47-457(+)
MRRPGFADDAKKRRKCGLSVILGVMPLLLLLGSAPAFVAAGGKGSAKPAEGSRMVVGYGRPPRAAAGRSVLLAKEEGKKDEGGFFSDPVGDPEQYQDNSVVGPLILAVGGAIFAVVAILPLLQNYLSVLGKPPPGY